MKNSSVFSCEHLHVRCAAGKTEAFVAALQKYLRMFFLPTAPAGSVDLSIVLDDQTHAFLWMGDVRPESDEGVIHALTAAHEIDIRLNVCCDEYYIEVEESQNTLAAMLESGALKDYVRYCALLEDEHTSSLLLSGLYRGAFLHGAVPFVSGNEDVLVDNIWNGYTHRAEFTLPAAAEDAVRDLADLLEEKLEIDLELSDDATSLTISTLQLCSLSDVEFYCDVLGQLVRLAENSLITGALTPEADTLFALLRFVQEGSAVAIETAVAER